MSLTETYSNAARDLRRALARGGPARGLVRGTVTGTDERGQAIVVIEGGYGGGTPVALGVAASVGDLVGVNMDAAAPYVAANYTAPPTDDQLARQAVADAALAHEAADAAQQSADDAAQAASDAQDSADEAAQAASSAQASADTAATAAANAQTSADAANTAALGALTGLAEVEDVLGTATWIAEHGTYALTEDEEVDPDKVYFTRTGSGTQADPYVYARVAEPTAEGLSGYYELSVNAALSQYVASHLALTDAGLYVIKDASGYRLLCSNDGVSVIDPQGNVVVTYGASISTDPARQFAIGNEDAYVVFQPATSTAPAEVIIGGNVVLGNAQKLSELLNALAYDYSCSYANGYYTFTGYAHKGGIDVSEQFDSSMWVWVLRTESGDTVLPSGRTCTVAASAAGLRGSIVGGLEETLSAVLVDENGNRIVDESGGGILIEAYWEV